MRTRSTAWSSRTLGRISMLLVVAVSFAACTPRLRSMYRDPSLSFAALREGKIAVLPLTSRSSVVSMEALSAMRSTLIDSVERHRRDLPIFSVIATSTASPVRVFDAAASGGAQFVVVTEITRYATANRSSSDKEETRNDKGEVTKAIHIQRFHSDAWLAGSMEIREAHTGRMVWQGEHEVSSTHTNEHRTDDSEKPTVLGAIVGFIGVLAGSSSGSSSYPAPTPPEELASALFAAFVLNWPDADDKK